VEVRRRTNVIGRFPGETSALSLIWAVLELSSRGWRGVKMNPKTVAEIERLRRQLRQDPAPPLADDTEQVIAAQDPQQAELRHDDFTRRLGRDPTTRTGPLGTNRRSTHRADAHACFRPTALASRAGA
jgi:hypothetical protein